MSVMTNHPIATALRSLTTSIGMTLALSVVTTVTLVTALPGCTSDTTTKNASGSPTSNEYLLSEKPESPVSLTEIAETFTPSDDPEAAPVASREVVLIGRIDAGDFPAFQEDQATFMLSELPAEGHGADDPDHEDNCPFCKRRASKAPKAIVNIVSKDDTPLPTDARTLLGVSQGDKIIAIGTASYDQNLNTITLNSQAIYKPQ